MDDDPKTVRLTYEFRPLANLEEDPDSDDDYEFVCYGGEDQAKEFGYDLRRRIAMDLLPALRDAEGDLANWRRSPLRPLIEEAFGEVENEELQKVADSVREARRLFYVGFTRTESELHLVFSANNASRFVREVEAPTRDQACFTERIWQ